MLRAIGVNGPKPKQRFEGTTALPMVVRDLESVAVPELAELVGKEQEHQPHELEALALQVELVAQVRLQVRVLPCPVPEVVRPVCLRAMGHEHHHVRLGQVVDHRDELGVDPEVDPEPGRDLGVDEQRELVVPEN